jgi:hypothetical protein
MTEGTSARNDRLAVALLIVLPTLLFGDVLLGAGNFYLRDLTRYYYPTKQIYREIVAGGEVPLWNRYFHGGQPIAANPEHEIFYPLTWLILLPSYDLGYRLHILIHLYIALLGMFALLRSMELRTEAAFFGAVAWGLGGVYLSYINLLPILFCAAWLPLTCLYARKFLMKRSRRSFALAAIFLGLQFLVAEPTTVVQTGFLVGMYALYRGWNDEQQQEQEQDGRSSFIVHRSSFKRIRQMAKNVAWIALISLAAFAIGAVQMLPAIDHVGDSVRSRAFPFEIVSKWSMPFGRLFELVYPNFFGHISVDHTLWYWAGNLYPGPGMPFLFSIYPGIAVAALAVAGIVRRIRGTLFVSGLILLSTLVAAGSHTPLLRAIYDLGIGTMRYPEKFLFFGAFALVLFAAQALDRILRGDRPLRDVAAGFALATSILAIPAFAASQPAFFSRLWNVPSGPWIDRMLALTRGDWALATVRGIVLTVLLLSIFKWSRAFWCCAAAAFVVVDLGLIAQEINPRLPRSFFTDPPPVEKTILPNRSDFRVFHEADWYEFGEPAKSYFANGRAPYWIARNGLFPMIPASQGIRTVMEQDYDQTMLLPTADFTQSVWEVARSGKRGWSRTFMAMSNAWYRTAYRPFEYENKRTGGNFKIAEPIGFLEGRHHPRYYFADQMVSIRNRRDFVQKLSSQPYRDRVAFTFAPAFEPAHGVVHGFRETANSATVDIEAFGRAFLVMSVTPHKYWRVTLDGQPVQPVVTNVGYQGIGVTAGRHRVEMRYRNPVVITGGVISALAALVVGALATVASGRNY